MSQEKKLSPKVTEEKINDMFKEGFNCGQVVLSSVAHELGMDEETAKKVAACFGAGMFCGKTCGAVTGSYMAIGLKNGNFNPNTPEIKNNMIRVMGEFNDKFLEKYSSTFCKELLGYDVGNPDEMNIILERGLLNTFCPKVVYNAIEILSNIL